MGTISTVKARNNFSDLLNKVAFGKERTILTRRGKKFAAVIPIEDLHLLEKIEDQMDIEEARKAMDEPGENEPWENVKKAMEL